MLNTYVDGTLTITREDGATLVYAYNPQTQVPFKDEDDAIKYAYSNPMYFTPLPTLEDMIKSKCIEIASINASAQVEVNGTIFNGGDASASAISGAVTLAQALSETTVKLWDIDNNVATYTFEEAMVIASTIAKSYRDIQLSKYENIAQIQACTTKEEFEAKCIELVL